MTCFVEYKVSSEAKDSVLFVDGSFCLIKFKGLWRVVPSCRILSNIPRIIITPWSEKDSSESLFQFITYYIIQSSIKVYPSHVASAVLEDKINLSAYAGRNAPMKEPAESWYNDTSCVISYVAWFGRLSQPLKAEKVFPEKEKSINCLCPSKKPTHEHEQHPKKKNERLSGRRKEKRLFLQFRQRKHSIFSTNILNELSGMFDGIISVTYYANFSSFPLLKK